MRDARVLVVEDNPTNLRLFTRLLQDAGYAVETATNGAEALHSIDRLPPDLILMDIQLPDTDGLTLTRTLRRQEKTSSVRIVAITAFTRSEAEALEAGCDGFIAKPIDTRAFPQTIAGYLDETV